MRIIKSRAPNAPFTCLTYAYIDDLSAELCTSTFLDGLCTRDLHVIGPLILVLVTKQDNCPGLHCRWTKKIFEEKYLGDQKHT